MENITTCLELVDDRVYGGSGDTVRHKVASNSSFCMIGVSLDILRDQVPEPVCLTASWFPVVASRKLKF